MSRRVILCSHNGARFIEEQISSIRAQTVPVDTIHVFDFASTDATRSILHRLATDAVLPRVFVKEHADAPGAALSFFRAFSEMAEVVSDTDCIFLADQDDVWLGTKVAQVTRRFDDAVAADPTGLVAVFHDVHVVDHALSPLRKSFYHADSPFALPRDLAPDRLLLANPAIGHTLAISGALLRAVNKSLTKSGLSHARLGDGARRQSRRFGGIHPRSALSISTARCKCTGGVQTPPPERDIFAHVPIRAWTASAKSPIWP